MFQPETRVIVSTETKTDVGAEIAKQLRTIQSYNWKLNNNVGTRENALKNIRQALSVIETLKQEASISQALDSRVMEFLEKFKTTQP